MTSPAQPIFYFDLGSPYAWLAAERIHQVLPTPIWQPILLGGIWQQTGGRSWATTEKRDEGMREVLQLTSAGALAYPAGPAVFGGPSIRP
jgi:2-hydroxychromene-2-carboxylate isomerase